MFGPLPSVTDYKLGQVLMVLGLDRDGSMLSYWSQHHYGKIMEGRHKAKSRGK